MVGRNAAGKIKSAQNRIVGEEGDDAHFPLAFGTGQGINLVDFPYHLGPAPAGDPRVLLLNDDEWMLVGLPLPHFAPVSIGIQAEVTDGDLALVWNMGGHPGDKLQIIHILDDGSEEAVLFLET